MNEDLDMFTTLITVMASYMYTYTKIYQIVHFECVQYVDYTLTELVVVVLQKYHCANSHV